MIWLAVPVLLLVFTTVWVMYREVARVKIGREFEEDGRRSAVDERLPIQTSNNYISVAAPAPYAKVKSPLVVAGTANAFEGTVQVVVRNQNGLVVGRTFTTASTADIGEHGDYRAVVLFDASPGENLVIEVFEESSRDGLPVYMVRIPVIAFGWPADD